MSDRWLYKIHSNYDGFRPGVIEQRLHPGRLIPLGWQRYLDEVDPGEEIWVYFHGQHRFDNGVYIKGFAKSIDRANRTVWLKVREYDTASPLTDSEMSARVAAAVATRYQQVFIFPDDLSPVAGCDIGGRALSCSSRLCSRCATWGGFPIVEPRDVKVPTRARGLVADVAPAYWAIPARCYLHSEHKPIRRGVRQTSNLFRRFKTGEQSLAFPFALGMFEALAMRSLLEDDNTIVVPIPLSPEKEGRGEIHRTRLLAKELARLLEVPRAELLTLSKSISKRKLGLPPAQFEPRYRQALVAKAYGRRVERILLVDDVATHGSTLAVAAAELSDLHPEAEIIGVTAARMILKSSVARETRIVSS